MKQMYSLFKKEGDKWVRVSPFACNKQTAVRVFQNQLINGSLVGQPMALRVVK